MATITFNMRAEGLPVKDHITRSSDPYIVIRLPDQIHAGHKLGNKFDAEKFDLGLDVGEVLFDAAAAVALGPFAIAVVAPLAAAHLVHTATKLHKPKKGYTEVYASEPIMRCLSPAWPEFGLVISDALSNSPHTTLLVEVWDWDRFSPSDYMGSCEINLAELLSKPGRAQIFALIDKKGRPRAGRIHISVRRSGAIHATSQQAQAAQSQTADDEGEDEVEDEVEDVVEGLSDTLESVLDVSDRAPQQQSAHSTYNPYPTGYPPAGYPVNNGASYPPPQHSYDGNSYSYSGQHERAHYDYNQQYGGAPSAYNYPQQHCTSDYNQYASSYSQYPSNHSQYPFNHSQYPSYHNQYPSNHTQYPSQ